MCNRDKDDERCHDREEQDGRLDLRSRRKKEMVYHNFSLEWLRKRGGERQQVGRWYPFSIIFYLHGKKGYGEAWKHDGGDYEEGRIDHCPSKKT